MSYLVSKYIGLLAHHLRNFKKKSPNLWNFSCPLCGDSQTHKSKARGYIFERKGNYFFKCHNCAASRSFQSLLKELNLPLYNEYRLEWLRESGNAAPEHTPVVAEPTVGTGYDDGVFKDLSRLTQLPNEHFARAFVTKRLIPPRFYSTMFFAPKYQDFVNAIIPGKLTGFKGPRIVIPFYSYKRELVGWQGRALDNHPVRYSYIVIDYNLPRAFGLNTANFNRKYYVLEGPIDSMFLDNAIAIGGSDLVGGIRRLGCPRDNAVIVFDNEPRNAEIVAKLHAAIHDNYSVVIWPPELPCKDINDMILDGGNVAQVQHLIDRSTLSGLPAELAFNSWKRI